MSYCRWSTDDYMCDVYVYEDVGGGWTTHVAGRRPVYKEPLPPQIPWTAENAERYFERMQIVAKMHDEAELVPIGLPNDGESFNDPTANDCAVRLRALRDLGYNVPQHAIDELESESP